MKYTHSIKQMLIGMLVVSAVPAIAVQPGDQGTFKKFGSQVAGFFKPYETKAEEDVKTAVSALTLTNPAANAKFSEKAKHYATKFIVNPWKKFTLEHSKLASTTKYAGMLAAVAAVAAVGYGIYRLASASNGIDKESKKKIDGFDVILVEAKKAIKNDQAGKSKVTLSNLQNDNAEVKAALKLLNGVSMDLGTAPLSEDKVIPAGKLLNLMGDLDRAFTKTDKVVKEKAIADAFNALKAFVKTCKTACEQKAREVNKKETK